VVPSAGLLDPWGMTVAESPAPDDLRGSLAWAAPVALVGTLGIGAWCLALYVAVAMVAGVGSVLFDVEGELSATPFWVLWAEASSLTWLVALGAARLLAGGALTPRSAGLLGGVLGCGAGACLVAVLG
jgi:hypothetical protein